jgi:hypothetical protein
VEPVARLLEFLHRQRRAVAAALGMATLLGVVAGTRLPAAILPEVSFPRIKVIADSGERSGDEGPARGHAPARAVAAPRDRGCEVRSITAAARPRSI